jgi:hypothetical protein
MLSDDAINYYYSAAKGVIVEREETLFLTKSGIS